MVLHVAAQLSSGPGPVEDAVDGLEGPELLGTKHRGNSQADIPHARRVRNEDQDRYEVCST